MNLTVRLAVADDRPALHALRRRVFVDEQRVPADLELDALDDGAVHAVACDDTSAVVGTGRLVATPDGTGRIGRMAVAGPARGRGVGAAVLAVLEGAAADAGCRRCEVHAQTHAVGFYRRAGYVALGPLFLEAGIAHLAMAKDLPRRVQGAPAVASDPDARPC